MHVFVDASARLVFVRRTPVPFLSTSEVTRTFNQVADCVDDLDRSEHAFLGDTRFGPARNDPAYEGVLQALRPKLLGRYVKAATLAKSAVGQLQIRRYAVQDGRELFITSSEEEAFEYLELPVQQLPKLQC